MPISASQIVDVSPKLLKSSSNNLEFNGLLLSKSLNIPFMQVLAFASPSEVEAYFGEEAQEAKLAHVYFLGYKNSTKKPNIMYVAPFVDANRAAWLRGESISLSLDELRNYTNSSIDITINDTVTTLNSIDFSQALSYSDIASILQNSIQSFGEFPFTDISVEYSALYKAFTIMCPASDDALISLSHCSGELAKALGLSSENNAIISQPSSALSCSENMELILEKTQNFVNFTTSWFPTKEEVLDFARFSSSKNTAYLFLYSDNDTNLVSPQIGEDETIAYALQEASLSAVAGQYAGLEYSVFLMGLAACIDWENIQSTITSAFKSQEGLIASVENASSAQSLISRGMNFVGDYATRNDNFIFHYPGQMFGEYKWIDSYWNAIWLNNALQVALMDGLSSSPRTPYSARGYTLIRAWLSDPVNRALRNGVIETGISLSESQKAQLNREVGKNIEHELSTSGFYIHIEDPGAEARDKRESPIVKLWYTYGGSVNSISVSSTSIV